MFLENTRRGEGVAVRVMWRKGWWKVGIKDAFRKIANQYQTDTNEMATTETKYHTDFYVCPKSTSVVTKFLKRAVSRYR